MSMGRLGMRGAFRRRRAAARPAVPLLLLALLLVIPACLAACGEDEPFAGLWWEPATGRRIEIRLESGQYWLYYGAAKRPHLAERDGDELRIRDPLGEDIVVRPGADGALEMDVGGAVTRLKRVPQHQ
jgi:hypothetical protein